MALIEKMKFPEAVIRAIRNGRSVSCIIFAEFKVFAGGRVAASSNSAEPDEENVGEEKLEFVRTETGPAIEVLYKVRDGDDFDDERIMRAFKQLQSMGKEPTSTITIVWVKKATPLM